MTERDSDIGRKTDGRPGTVLCGMYLVLALVSACNGAGTGRDAGSQPSSGDGSTSTHDAGGGAHPPSNSGDAGHDADAHVSDATGASVDATQDAASSPWVTFVNASPDFGPLDLCLTLANSSTPDAPPIGPLAPNSGMGAPYGATLPDIDWTTSSARLYAISTAGAGGWSGPLNGGPGCAELTAPDAGYGAVFLGEIVGDTFFRQNAYVVAVVGCGPESPVGALCGSSYSADAGNYRISSWRMDFTTHFDGSIGAQFIQLSSQWDEYAGAVLGVGAYSATRGSIQFYSDAGSDDADAQSMGDATTDADAAADGRVATDATATPESEIVGSGSFLSGPSPNSAIEVTGLGSESDDGGEPSFVVTALLASGDVLPLPDGGSMSVAFPLSTIANDSYDGGPPSAFLSSGNWAFMLVGEPNADGGAENPFSLRVIALPNGPPP